MMQKSKRIRRIAFVLILFGALIQMTSIAVKEVKEIGIRIAANHTVTVTEVTATTLPEAKAVTQAAKAKEKAAVPLEPLSLTVIIPPQDDEKSKSELPELIQQKQQLRAAAKEAKLIAEKEAAEAAEAAKKAESATKITVAIYDTITSTYTVEIYNSIEELANNCSLTVDEIIYIMKALYGEANAVESKAERSMVVWVILNRLDTPGYGFGDSIEEIITKPFQFTGYLESNPVTDRSFEVVCDVIMRWEAEKRGETNVGRTIPKEVLFFHADHGHNAFYRYTEVNRGEKIYFDREHPLENPYEN